ncbi:MAG: sugar ABC transporter permease, partial [Clostridiales bacterium]|nr:sugar ABC transporter permease [Clostridiales bacterium]
TLLSVGKVFFADFGMFFQLTGNYGILYPTTLVIDTYVYNAFKLTMDMGMSTAAGLSQSIAGFICILGTNLIVRRVNKPFALF